MNKRKNHEIDKDEIWKHTFALLAITAGIIGVMLDIASLTQTTLIILFSFIAGYLWGRLR